MNSADLSASVGVSGAEEGSRAAPPAPPGLLAQLRHLAMALQRQIAALSPDDPLLATLQATLADVQARLASYGA